MPYAQRLTSIGVFIHGMETCNGAKVPMAASACLRPSPKSCSRVTKLGDVVVITDGKRLDISKAQVGG